ncbi:hypothetical protein Hanom_Chr08g00741461 [Helianthus anomalus]
MVRNFSKGDRGVNVRQEPTFYLFALTAFLAYDCSFFSPWNHRSDVPSKCCSCCAKYYIMQFEAGSFFTYDITAMRGEGVGNQEKRSYIAALKKKSYIAAFYNK